MPSIEPPHATDRRSRRLRCNIRARKTQREHDCLQITPRIASRSTGAVGALPSSPRSSSVTAVLPQPRSASPLERVPSPRRYLMCRPEHFEVSYAINPWMDVTAGVDRELALRQWETLRQTYLDLGPRGRGHHPGAGPAGHGLRRQRRPGHRGPGARRPVHPRGAPRRGPGLPGLAGRRRAQGRHRAGARQRGRGRLPRRRRAGPGRHRASAPTPARTPRCRSCSASR